MSEHQQHSKPQRRALTPSLFSQYCAYVAKDLRMEFRTREMITSMIVYAVLVLTIYGAAISQTTDAFDVLSIAAGLLWALIVFTSLLGLNRSFAHEVHNGCLDAVLMSPVERSVIFIAKMTTNLIFLAIVELVVVPLFFVMFLSGTPLGPHAWQIIIPLFVGTWGVAAVGTLLATMTLDTRGKDVLLAILFIPLVFPLLWACVSATGVLLLGVEGTWPLFIKSIALAAGYDVMMTAAAWALYEFTVSGS